MYLKERWTIGKVRFWLASVALLLILTGCGADLRISTVVNPDGSGTRTFQIIVPDDQMKEVIGGEPALTKALTEEKPSFLQMEKKQENGATTYLFTLSFQSIEELNGRSGDLAGEYAAEFPPKPIEFTRTGTPFSRHYEFQDPNPVELYFGWVENAVLKANIIPDEYRDDLINDARSEVLLPQDAPQGETGGGSVLLYPGKKATSEKHYPVESVYVQTDIRKRDEFVRTIALSVSQETDRQLQTESPDAIATYLKGLSADDAEEIAVTESDGRKEYRVTLRAPSFEKLVEMTRPYLDVRRAEFQTVKKSAFFPVESFVEEVDLSFFLGESYIVNSGFSYRLLYRGQEVAADGKSIVRRNGAKPGERLVESTGPVVGVSMYIRRTTPAYYAAVASAVLVVLAALAALLVHALRHPEKWREVFQKASSAVVSALRPQRRGRSEAFVFPRFCYDCGKPVERTDRFCHNCGSRLIPEERSEPA